MMASRSRTPGKRIKVPKKAAPEKEAEEYVTPGGYELEKLLNRGCVEYTRVNEVWPNVFIGDEETARSRHGLERMGVTHVLNAAEGTWNCVDTGADYYSGMGVAYYGVAAEDVPGFDISQYFYPAGLFIDQTLSRPENKLLVHCVLGRSRSATLVLAYLMIYKEMTLVDAIEHVKRRRRIVPNWGFLKQLRRLDTCLLEQRRAGAASGKVPQAEAKDR